MEKRGILEIICEFPDGNIEELRPSRRPKEDSERFHPWNKVERPGKFLLRTTNEDFS
jgi:hypothetical protein